MDKKSWKDQKNEIYFLIKKISDNYGGDDLNWLREYAVALIDAHREDLMPLLLCMLSLEKKIDYKTNLKV